MFKGRAASKQDSWIAIVTTFACLILVGLTLSAIMRYASSQLLERDAEHTALAWAEFVSATVPDLEQLLTQGVLTQRAHEELKRFRHVQEVFRFKMFDRRGHAVLVSDDLDKPRGSPPSESTIGHGNEHVRNMVLSGSNVILLVDNTQKPDRPAVFSEAYVPIYRDGELIGVVEVYVDQVDRAKRIYKGFQLVSGVLFLLLSAIGLAVFLLLMRRLHAQRRAEEHMRYLAQYDVLTGLLNRASFSEALRNEIYRHTADGLGFAVLCIDLDHFKEVNDSLGHGAGDELLRQVAERLREAVRHGDWVARLGGDEFAILQAGVSEADDVTMLADRVVCSLNGAYNLGAERVRGGASVGAAIFGIDASSEEELMHKADLALYRAKGAGRGGFSFYDVALDKQLETRRTLIQDLREAIGSDQLRLYYQALYKSDGKTLCGYEALLRWLHPSDGFRPPDLFIPLAEDTGLIEPLGRWVIHAACAQAAQWPEHLSVAINLSAAQFRQGDLVEEVAQALDAHSLRPSRLELEITESLLMNNTEQVLQTLQQLTAMGVRIAMDDFGTGYSSMAYLWRFPFNKIKIDRAFTEHLGQDAKVSIIVKSIISLAHSLGVKVNAEGVETPAQLEILQQYGCNEYQGYFLARPLPPEQLPHTQWQHSDQSEDAQVRGAKAADRDVQ